MSKLTLKKAFETVFDENGNMKLCGREACKELIRLCMEKDSKTDFGNPNTGQISLQSYETMKELCN